MSDTTAVLDSPEAINEHLRYAITADDLAVRGVRFVLCTTQNEVMAHVHVADDTDDPVDTDEEIVVSAFAQGVVDHGLADALLVALTRPGRPTLTAEDRRWYHATRRACAERSIRLLGVHLVTPRGVREVLLDDAI